MAGMSKKPYPSQVQDRYIVRFPDGMRDRLAEAARANGRSMNAEIVARLEQSFAKPVPALRSMFEDSASDHFDQMLGKISESALEELERAAQAMAREMQAVAEHHARSAAVLERELKKRTARKGKEGGNG